MGTINEDLIRLIVAQIEDTPEHWDQCDWARSSEVSSPSSSPICKTTFCFAGWAAFLTDMVDGWGRATAKGRRWMKANDPNAADYQLVGNFHYEKYATEILGLTIWQSGAIFSPAAATKYGDDNDNDNVDEMKKTITRVTGIAFP